MSEQNNSQNAYALYSNIALLNLKKLVEKNLEEKLKEKDPDKRRIEESNIEQNLVDKDTNEYIFKNSKLLNFFKKNLEEKEYLEIFKFLVNYLLKIRNLSSHSRPEYIGKNQTKTNQFLYEESYKKLEPLLKKAIENSSKTPIFKSLKQKDWDNFIIQLFLYKNEWNEFQKELNIEIDERFLRGYRFRLRKHTINKQFYFQVANYLKNFNETNNKRKAFISLSMKLLSYFYKDESFSLNIFKNNRRGLVVEISFFSRDKKEIKKVFLNLQGMRQLLLFLSLKNQKYKITNKIFQLKQTKNHEHIPIDNYNSFKNKFKNNSKITNMHLLKILNKALRYSNKENQELYQNGMNADLFNQLLQYLNLNNGRYIDLNHANTQKLFLEIGAEKPQEPTNLIVKIKEYILKVISSQEIYNYIFKQKQEKDNKEENIWKENPKLSEVKKEWNIDDKIYDPLFDFKNKNTSNDNLIKSLIAPIALLYFKKAKELSDKDSLNEKEIETIFNNSDELPINRDIIINIFKNRIWKEKAEVFEFENIVLEISINDYWSNYEVINSKLFWELLSLSPNKNFKNILKKYNEYKAIENDLVSIAIKTEDLEGKSKERDYILHRSISKFGSWNKILSLLEKSSKTSLPFKAKAILRPKDKGGFKNNNEIDEKLEEYNKEIKEHW